MEALIRIVKGLFPGSAVTPQLPYGNLTPAVRLVTADGRVARVSGAPGGPDSGWILVTLQWDTSMYPTSLGSWKV